MPDYQKSKIYKIWSPSCDKIYIGSTTETRLCQKMADIKNEHKRHLNGKYDGNNSSYELISLGDAVIELIELYPCNSKDELLKRQTYHINLNKNICTNKTIYNPENPRFNCECGVQVSKRNKRLHEQSELHGNNMLLKENHH